MTVAVLLPTLNETGSIGQMIDRVRAVDSDYKIYVVDSGSTDGTLDVAKEKGAEVILLGERGKGRAIREAFGRIEEEQAVLLDSDLTYHPEEIPALLRALESCDVVLGSRFKGEMEEGAMTSLNRFGNHRLTDIANVLYGKRISDVCSGFWAFRKSAYKKMLIDAPHFELEANFFSQCAKLKLNLCEVPIRYGKRTGETKLNTLHGLKIGLYLLTRRF
ncbi:TPA: glycosyltransferase [Candidatus Micrarchaeota archaeon]|nr:glycosyltransferase [Candidatus Micrarchaeota archaeon]